MYPLAYPAGPYHYGAAPPSASDGEIKSAVVGRLRENARTRNDRIVVDVDQGVVVLAGVVSSAVAKRAAGDDAWDTPGVVDVSNQLQLAGGNDDRRPPG